MTDLGRTKYFAPKPTTWAVFVFTAIKVPKNPTKIKATVNKHTYTANLVNSDHFTLYSYRKDKNNAATLDSGAWNRSRMSF